MLRIPYRRSSAVREWCSAWAGSGKNVSDRLEAIGEKIKNKQPLTLDEFQCLHLDVCSHYWNIVFPTFLKDNQVSLDSTFLANIWETMWEAALDAEAEQEKEKKAIKRFRAVVWLRTPGSWHVPDVECHLRSKLEKHGDQDFIFDKVSVIHKGFKNK